MAKGATPRKGYYFGYTSWTGPITTHPTYGHTSLPTRETVIVPTTNHHSSRMRVCLSTDRPGAYPFSIDGHVKIDVSSYPANLPVGHGRPHRLFGKHSIWHENRKTGAD